MREDTTEKDVPLCASLKSAFQVLLSSTELNNLWVASEQQEWTVGDMSP